MEQSFSDRDISTFLKLLLEEGEMNVVDDSPDMYIRLKATGKQETISVDGRSMPLAIYGTKATDAMIINPFAEGEAESIRSTWFYTSRNLVISSLVAAIVKKLLEVGAASASKKKDDNPDRKAIALMSKRILDVDEKMVKEFSSLTKAGDLRNFFQIYYNKTAKQGEVRCVVFVEAQRKAYPSIRVKTWEVLEGLIKDILNINDLSELNYSPKTIGIPVFESYVNIYINVLKRLAEPLKIIGKELKNIGTLESHLKYLPQYYGRAKWCTTPQANVSQQPVLGLPWSVPLTVPTPGVTVPGAMVPGIPGMVNTSVPMPMSPYGMPMPGMLPAQAPGFPAINVPMGVPPQVPAPIMPQPATQNSDNPFTRA